MSPSKRFGRFIAIVLLPLLASALTACKPYSIKPAPVQTEPPRVDCQRTPPAQVPPIPPLSQMDEWALSVMAIVEAERTKWQAEQDCMARLRKDGVIR